MLPVGSPPPVDGVLRMDAAGDLVQAIIFLLFIAAPILKSIFRAAREEKAGPPPRGTRRPSQEPQGSAPPALPDHDSHGGGPPRFEFETLPEVPDGERTPPFQRPVTWEELMRGEVPPFEPAPAAPSRSIEPDRERPGRSTGIEAMDTRTAEEPGIGSGGLVPGAERALSTLEDRHLEPALEGELVLEARGRPEPFAGMGDLPSASQPFTASRVTRLVRTTLEDRVRTRGLGRAIVLSEILSPPLALRRRTSGR